MTKAGPNALTLIYNDAKRTLQTTTDPGGPRIVCDLTFDAHGKSGIDGVSQRHQPAERIEDDDTAIKKICR